MTGRRWGTWMISAASRLLPPHLSSWSRAMARELMEIPDDRSALIFAAGCLRAAAAVAVAGQVRAGLETLRLLTSPSLRRHMIMKSLSAQPRLLGLLCGAVAVSLGLAYMQAAGAPPRYLLVNLGALVLGATAWLALGPAAASRAAANGAATLALSIPLLLTAFFGVAAEGASRWVSVGPLTLQVSLILLPVMIALYARRPDPAGTAGMIVAAAALALQPDRAMAAVLAASLLPLAFATKGRLPILTAGASILAFGSTLLTPDSLGASPFVDRILFTAFDVHPLAGAAVLLGAAALLVPAAAGLLRGAGDRPVLLAFAGCWSAVIAAAALGNNPTPLVGYGGSAVLGYLLSVALLSNRARDAATEAVDAPPAADRNGDPSISELRVPHPA